MFNTTTQDDLKSKAANMAENAKDNANQVANEFRNSAENIGNTVQKKATETKHEALNVIDSLKALLTQYTSATNITELKNQILDKAYQLKGTVKDEVVHAYEVGKDRTVHTVQEKPLMTLGLAVAAGVLLGYILGSKQSSKE